MKGQHTGIKGVSTLALAIGLAAGGMDAVAQTDAETESTEVALLDEMTVMATRRAMPAYETPSMVSVVDRSEIQDLMPSAVSDIFRTVPGVQFTGGPRRGGEMPSIRGVGASGVLVYFDGARQSFLSGHDGRFFIDPSLLKAVEVVRGPSSALYGSSALGGVLAFRTVDAGDFLGNRAGWGAESRLSYQSVNDEWLGTATAFGRGNGLDGVASVTYRDSGDIELGSGDTLPADTAVVSSLLKGSAEIADDLEVQANWTRYDGDARGPANPQGGNVAGPQNPLADKTIKSDTGQVNLDFTPGDQPLIDFHAVAYHSRTKVREAEIDSGRVVTRRVTTQGLRAENHSQLFSGPAASLVLTYGGEYYQDDQVGRDSTSPDGSRGGVPDAEADFLGLFAQATLEGRNVLGLPGRWSVIPGIRYDEFETETPDSPANKNDAVSPKMGISYEPTPWLMVFGNYAEAFRAPSMNEAFADGIHFQIPLGPGVVAPNFFETNPDLVPENSTSWEGGAGFNFRDLFAAGDRLQIKGAYYQSDIDNLINLEVDMSFSRGCFAPGAGPCTSGTSRYVNVRDARIHGVEVELDYDGPRFYARAHFSTMDGKDRETGEYIGVLSPARAYLDAGVKIHEADLRVGSRLEAADDFTKVNDPSEERDSYALMDLYGVWQPDTGALSGLRLEAGVDNLTDTNYERVFAGVSEPGRNFKVSVAYRATF